MRWRVQKWKDFHDCALVAILGRQCKKPANGVEGERMPMSYCALYSRCDSEGIEAHRRRMMLRWLGHIGRMEASSIPKQLL